MSTKPCSSERKTELSNKIKNYTKKNIGEPFMPGQKYYILDNNVPNCVNSFICKQPLRKGQTHPSLGQTFDNNICFSYDSQFNAGNEQKQLDTITNNYNEYGKSDEFKVKVYNKGKYKYELNDQPDIYYRTCPMWGCKSGTSLIELAKGGRKTRRRSRKYRFNK